MDGSFLKQPPRIKPAIENESGEVSLEEREVVKRVEKLKTNDYAKAEIILVWKGKSAAEFEFADYATEHEAGRLEQAAEARKLFDDLGLFSHRVEEEIPTTRFDPEGNATPGKFYRDKYFIARNKDDLDYFIDNSKKGNSEITAETIRKTGAAFGYPRSAIDAWSAQNRDDVVLPWDYTKEPDSRDEMAFADFRLSRANWQKEFEIVKKWADEIKRLAPAIYKNIVEQYRDNFIDSKDDHESGAAEH